MVGNGVTNWTYDTQPAFVEMAYWHSLYDTATYDLMKSNNCDFGLFNTNMSDICLVLLDKFNFAVKDINVYNILELAMVYLRTQLILRASINNTRPETWEEL